MISVIKDSMFNNFLMPKLGIFFSENVHLGNKGTSTEFFAWKRNYQVSLEKRWDIDDFSVLNPSQTSQIIYCISST
jgi:hypothetical protein